MKTNRPMKRLIFSLLFLLVGLSASAQQGSHPLLAGEPDRKELLQMIDSCVKAENQIQMQEMEKMLYSKIEETEKRVKMLTLNVSGILFVIILGFIVVSFQILREKKKSPL